MRPIIERMDINQLDNDNSEPLKWSDFIVVVVYFLMIIITGLIVSYFQCSRKKLDTFSKYFCQLFFQTKKIFHHQ